MINKIGMTKSRPISETIKKLVKNKTLTVMKSNSVPSHDS